MDAIKKRMKTRSLLRCLLSNVKKISSMLLFFVRIAVASIFARLSYSIARWASHYVEYHGVDTLTWVAFKNAYIRKDYGGLLIESAVNALFSSKYSDERAWRKIVEEYASLTGSTSWLMDAWAAVQRKMERQIRLDSVQLLVRYKDEYKADFMKLTGRPTFEKAVKYAQMERDALNDSIAAYEAEIKKHASGKSDVAEHFIEYEYSISKHCGYNVVSDSITVKEMVVYMNIYKREMKEAKNGGQ